VIAPSGSAAGEAMVELLRERLHLHGERGRLDRFRGKHAGHDGHDAQQRRIAGAEVLGAIEVAHEERGGLAIAWIGAQVRIGLHEALGLPVFQRLQALGARAACARPAERLQAFEVLTHRVGEGLGGHWRCFGCGARVF
jgi:hypothetical protein